MISMAPKNLDSPVEIASRLRRSIPVFERAFCTWMFPPSHFGPYSKERRKVEARHLSSFYQFLLLAVRYLFKSSVAFIYIYFYKHMTHESEVDWYSIKMCTSLLCLNQLEYIFAPSVFFLSCFKDCLFFVCSFHPKLQKVCKSLLNFYSVAKNNLRSRKRNGQLSKYTHGKRFDTQTRIWLVAG